MALGVILMFDAKLKSVRIQQLLGAPGARNLRALNIFSMIIITVPIITRNNIKSFYKILFEIIIIS